MIEENEDKIQMIVGEELYQLTCHAQTVIAERELSLPKRIVTT
jgi:hypothetical protein